MFGVAGIDSLDGSEETIAAAGESFDESRTAGRVAEGLANAVDRRVDAVLVVDERALWPKHAGDLVARNQLARLLEEHEKNLEWLGVQLYAHPLPAQLARGGIRFKDSKAIALCRPKVAFQVRHVFRSVYPMENRAEAQPAKGQLTGSSTPGRNCTVRNYSPSDDAASIAR
jgi:hypothetical protein